jgi:hypothetical protein
MPPKKIEKRAANRNGRDSLKQASEEVEKLFSKQKKTKGKDKVIEVQDVKKPLEPDWIDMELKGRSKGRGASGRRTTEEGYPIYAEEEIVSHTGGSTSKCPFDCECCF